jgi:dephospho-CoA kinase
MLRVGLTGGLGSGKSTVATFLRELGAHVVEADVLGRQMMEPGHEVYKKIVRTFGPEVVLPDSRLNRARLAELAFRGGRLHELNAIVHPAVIVAQQKWMEDIFEQDPAAIAIVESALIFEVVRDAVARGENDGILADWRRRIDCVVLVTAPDHMKIARYVARTNPDGPARKAAEADARLRIAQQIPDAEKAVLSDYVIDNSGDKAALYDQVADLWHRLKSRSDYSSKNLSLQ